MIRSRRLEGNRIPRLLGVSISISTQHFDQRRHRQGRARFGRPAGPMTARRFRLDNENIGPPFPLFPREHAMMWSGGRGVAQRGGGTGAKCPCSVSPAPRPVPAGGPALLGGLCRAGWGMRGGGERGQQWPLIGGGLKRIFSVSCIDSP